MVCTRRSSRMRKLKRRAILLAIIPVLVIVNQPAWAQGVPASGLYQIILGRYVECCGIGGAFSYPLPTATQEFVELRIEPELNLAQMTFLAPDRHTVFHTSSFGPLSGFTYAFTNGMVFTDHIQFGGPVPPRLPRLPDYSYTVSNSADGLRINGVVNTPCVGCADLPTEFWHTNVVAVLLPAAPVIRALGREGGLLRFRFTGEPSFDYFVEF